MLVNRRNRQPPQAARDLIADVTWKMIRYGRRLCVLPRAALLPRAAWRGLADSTKTDPPVVDSTKTEDAMYYEKKPQTASELRIN